MNAKLIVGKILCSLAIYSTAHAAPVQWTTASGGNGHWYEMISGALGWDAAKLDSESRTYLGVPGHLAVITSEEENNFVGALKGSGETWLGGFQAPGSTEPAGGWQWITGEAWGFTSWGPGEPSNDYVSVGGPVPFHSSEEVLVYNGVKIWNDLPRAAVLTTRNGWIVEYEAIPEPSSIVLGFLGLGCLASLAIRRQAPDAA